MLTKRPYCSTRRLPALAGEFRLYFAALGRGLPPTLAVVGPFLGGQGDVAGVKVRFGRRVTEKRGRGDGER